MKEKKNYTRKINSFSSIKKYDDLFTNSDILNIRNLVDDYFTNTVLPKLEKMERPLKVKYGDLIERNKGRFEITPPKSLETKIKNVLMKNKKFIYINNLLKNIIKNNYGDVIEEFCILPLEGNTRLGKWHRDIFVKSKNDFSQKVFYITQIIYLDNLSNTEFCLNSNFNNDNNKYSYDKKIVKSTKGSSVVFDGRTLHRGLDNDSNDTRYALYISYYKSSYVDKEGTLKKLL